MVREKTWERLISKVITWSTTYQSLSLRLQSKMLYSLFFFFCSMTPIYLCHLLFLLTQTRLKESHVFQVFILSISTILLLVGEEDGALFTPLPSWYSIQHSRFGSTTVSTLACGAEETTWYLVFADRHREQRNSCWPTFTGHLSSRSFLLNDKKCTILALSQL